MRAAPDLCLAQCCVPLLCLQAAICSSWQPTAPQRANGDDEAGASLTCKVFVGALALMCAPGARRLGPPPLAGLPAPLQGQQVVSRCRSGGAADPAGRATHKLSPCLGYCGRPAALQDAGPPAVVQSAARGHGARCIACTYLKQAVVASTVRARLAKPRFDLATPGQRPAIGRVRRATHGRGTTYRCDALRWLIVAACRHHTPDCMGGNAGEWILEHRPRAVIVETACNPTHGSVPGSIVSCADPVAEGSAFFQRMFCQVGAGNGCCGRPHNQPPRHLLQAVAPRPEQPRLPGPACLAAASQLAHEQPSRCCLCR